MNFKTGHVRSILLMLNNVILRTQTTILTLRRLRYEWKSCPWWKSERGSWKERDGKCVVRVCVGVVDVTWRARRGRQSHFWAVCAKTRERRRGAWVHSIWPIRGLPFMVIRRRKGNERRVPLWWFCDCSARKRVCTKVTSKCPTHCCRLVARSLRKYKPMHSSAITRFHR